MTISYVNMRIWYIMMYPSPLKCLNNGLEVTVALQAFVIKANAISDEDKPIWEKDVQEMLIVLFTAERTHVLSDTEGIWVI